MAKLSDFATDTESAEDGKWFVIRPKTESTPEFRVRIRASTSRLFRRTEQRLQKQFRAKFVAGGGFLDPVDQDDFDTQLAVAALVVGWEGLSDEEGKPIAYSKKEALTVLAEYPALRREIFLWARSEENYKPADVAKAELDAMGKT